MKTQQKTDASTISRAHWVIYFTHINFVIKLFSTISDQCLSQIQCYIQFYGIACIMIYSWKVKESIPNFDYEALPTNFLVTHKNKLETK